MDRIEQLRVFICVAKLNSFSHAAKQLNLPRSSVTHAIQQLEAHYAIRLFQRTTRCVNLTYDGAKFLPLSQNLLLDFDYLDQQAQQSTQKYHGTLKVDMPNRIAHHIVIPALPQFFQQYPAINIQFDSSDQFANLHEQSIDCAIRVGRLTDSSLIARQIGYLEMINCASPDYLANYNTPVHLSDLTKHQLVNYGGAVGECQAAFQYGTHHVMMNSRVGVNNTEAYITAAKAGLGIIQIPLYDVQDELQKGTLIAILPTYTAPAMPIHLLYQNREHQPSRLIVFLRWLQQLDFGQSLSKLY